MKSDRLSSRASLPLMQEAFRWYGPSDPVPLAHIRQTGAAGVYNSLHEIAYGDLWPREAIRQRKAMIEAAGLKWIAVESVPVHEDIKLGTRRCEEYLANYAQTLRNLGAEGVHVVIYNFMPVLDWVRTNMAYQLPDGSECLRFDPVHFAAFEIHALQRKGAEADYTPAQIAAAAAYWNGLDVAGRERFIRDIIDVFPGCKLGLSLDDIRRMLARYAGIDRAKLKANLKRFLQAVIPAAEESGVRLAIHPDDPPFSILGLPRILSTASDIEDLYQMVQSPANGLCLCAGSLSPRADNDLTAMAKRFGARIHAVHLRSTQREPDGSFYEANHLEGSVDMPALVRVLLDEQTRRRSEGRKDWQLSFRPDHGHTMMDDLAKPPCPNPGYSGIGRMRGLAELRGLQLGLAVSQWG